jgi:hypothetical protein
MFPPYSERMAVELGPRIGGVGYPPGHPGRWAGAVTSGTARISVEDGAVVVRQMPPWRWLGMPALRIPLAGVKRAARTNFGLRLSVPGEPSLDGVRITFSWHPRRSRDDLVALLMARGIRVDTLPVAERAAGAYRNWAIAGRPGWFFRDRGRLAYLEMAVVFALVLVPLILLFGWVVPGAPTFFVVWVAIVALVSVLGPFLGARERRRVKRQATGSSAGRTPA